MSSSSSSSSSQVLPPPPLDPSTTEKVDDDDEDAAIDIGSAYIVSGTDDYRARMNANVVGDADYSNGFVRVKSSHGHLATNANVDGDRRRLSQSSLQSTMFASS